LFWEVIEYDLRCSLVSNELIRCENINGIAR